MSAATCAARRAPIRRGCKAPTPCTPGCCCGAATAAGWGWIGLDPDQCDFGGEDHVTLAIGRDYTDVAPMDGVILGSGGQHIDVAVAVTPAA